MTDSQVIVNKLLEGDPDDPHAYLDWLGQKVETGPLDKIRFGAHIHTSDEGMIRDNASEQGIDVDSQAFWDEIERNLAIIEANCLGILRSSGLHISDEGHDETGARVASVWITAEEDDRKLAMLKAVINWAEGDWPSTTSGTMDYAFGDRTTGRIFRNTSDLARFIDVTIEFTGTDALVEWSRLNLNEAITGDPDDPEVFLRSYMPRMMGRVFIDFDAIRPNFPDAPRNWQRQQVNGLDLFRYNRVGEMREVLRQMKADHRQRGPNVPVDVITYRYKVSNPQGSSIVRGWLDKIGCPVPVIQWLCETNAPIWFFVPAKEVNDYMRMVYPQVKLESLEDPDDPETFIKSYRKTYYNLFYGRKFGEGAFVGVYDSLEAAATDAKRRKLRARARHVWVTEEACPDQTLDDNAILGSQPTGIVYDILQGYKISEPRRVVTEGAEDEDIDPKQYLDATTGWIDTFLNAGMQPDTSGSHDGQFWKRYECHGFNYIVVVGSRVPRFMIVERNDALYGTNTFRRVFDYPDRDTNGLVTEFTALNRLLTKAITSAFDGFPAFDEKVDQLYKQHKRRRQRWLSGKVKESLDEPEQYLKGNVYTLDELRTKLETYGLSFPSNGIKPWGRWAVIDGFTYWAVYSKDPDKWLPQSYFREQLEKFCKEMGFTVYHIQLFGEYPEGVTFKLAVPKMQIDPEAYGPQERRLNDPDFDNERQAHDTIQRDWLPEAVPDLPAEDTPEHYVQTAHTDMKRVIPSLGFAKPDPGHNFGDNHYFFYGHDNNNDFSDRYTLTITDHPKEGYCIVCGWRRGEASHCVSVSYDELIPYITRLKQILDTTYRADVQSALKRAKVQEALDIPPEDEPAPNIEKHVQHVEKVEADAIESAILNATNEFDITVRMRGIDNARRADELAAELGAKWAETAGYPNGSDEFDTIVSAVNNHCGEMFPGQWEDYPASDYPVDEALDPDDPQEFLQHMETDWRKILRKHGFKPHPHSDHLSYTLEYPDRVWGANWPVPIYAGHGWNPEPEFTYDHPDPDNPDLDAEDAAYEQWQAEHGLGAEIRRRDVNFPDYVYFQFGREVYRRIEVPTNKLDSFLSRLIRAAKQVVGTETIKSEHEGRGLTNMLWDAGKAAARELQIPLKESVDLPPEDDNPEAYLHHLTQINLADLYQQQGLQSNDEGDYGHGLMELGKPAAMVWHGKTHQIEKINLAVHTHPFRQWASVSIYIHPISNQASWRTFKPLTFRYWTVPLSELRDIVHKMIYEIEGVCLVNDLTWPEMVAQFKAAMKRFRPYRPLVARKKKVVEGVDDPTPEFLQAAFDVPAILKRMGYERGSREETPFEWFKVFHRMPTELDIMVEVKRRGLGGEENEADIVYDITVYRYPVNDNPGREWVPIAYRYERNNKQLERVLLKLEDRIRRNDLRGIRDEVAESVPEPPPEDDPTDVLKSHEKNLLPAELKRLDFGPKPEQGKEWIYGVEMPRYWWNRYTATDGKVHGLYVYFISGQTPEIRANNWNFDAKAWFQRGNQPPTDCPAQSEAHFCAILRDLDDAMKRSAADSLSPEQEHEAVESVLSHHRKWWDDTLDYLINTKGGTIPGQVGPGQPA